MSCATKVTIGGGGTRVSVQGGTAKRITLDARIAAVIADRRPQTVTQPRNTQVDVTSKPTTVTAGSGMGVQGPKGSPGGAYYEHTQSTPATDWVVQHDLGFYPDITMRTTGGLVIEADVHHLSINHAQIRLNTPMAGTARAE